MSDKNKYEACAYLVGDLMVSKLDALVAYARASNHPPEVIHGNTLAEYVNKIRPARLKLIGPRTAANVYFEITRIRDLIDKELWDGSRAFQEAQGVVDGTINIMRLAVPIKTDPFPGG